MRVDSRRPEHRAAYEIFLGDVNVTGIVVEADDIAGMLTVAPRDQQGNKYRHPNGRQLEVTVYGPVTIMARIQPLVKG